MASTSFDSDLAGKIISANALEAFSASLAPVNSFSTSFNDDAQSVGSQVIVPFISEFAATGTSQVGDFSEGSSTYDDTGTTGITESTVALSSHKRVTWELNDIQAANYSTASLERFGKQKGADLAKAVFQDILSAVTSSNFADSVAEASSTFDAEDIIEIRKEMVNNGGDISQCALILAPDYYAGLLADDRFKADAYGSDDAIKGGNVPSVVGIPSVFESNAIPDNSENLVGLLVHPSAIAVAMRYLAPLDPSAYGRADRLTDENGLVMGYREFYSPEKGKQFATLESLYGYATVNGDAIIRITSS